MNFENRMSRAHGGLQKFDYKTALKILLYPLCRLGGGMNRTGISILQRFCNNIFWKTSRYNFPLKSEKWPRSFFLWKSQPQPWAFLSPFLYWISIIKKEIEALGTRLLEWMKYSSYVQFECFLSYIFNSK